MLVLCSLTLGSDPFYVATDPPRGFEVLTQPMRTMVDVYYGHRHFMSTMAVISPDTIRFSDPELLVEQLPLIKDRVLVTAALTGRLSTNSHLLCMPGETDLCGVLQPDIAGVIFDSRRFQATVFVAPDYLENRGDRSKKNLPPATTFNTGVLQTLNFVSSGQFGGNNSENRNRDVLYANTLIGRKELSLESDWNIARGKGSRISSLFAERDFQGTDVRAGYISTSGFGFSFSPDRPILGVHAGISENTRLDLDIGRTTPLDVFLPVRGKVEVFRDGVLLNSWLLDAGSHLLPPGSFPQGSYNLLIRVLGEGGQLISVETRFFVSQPGLPPLGTPLWFAEAGRVLDYQRLHTLPKVQDNWLVRGGVSCRLADVLGGGISLAATRKAAIAEARLQYAGHLLDFTPSLFVSDHKDLGISIDVQSRWQGWLFSMGYRRLHLKKAVSADPVLYGQNNSSEYASVSRSLFQGNFQYRYHKYTTERVIEPLASSQARSVTLKNPAIHTLSYQRIFFQDNVYELEGHFEAGKYGRDRQILAGVSLRHNMRGLNHSVGARYRGRRDDARSWDTEGALRYSFSYQNDGLDSGHVFERDLENHPESYRAMFWAEASKDEQQLGGELNYYSRMAELYLGIDHGRYQSSDQSFSLLSNDQFRLKSHSTAWSASASTSLTWSSGSFAMGGEQFGRSALVVQMDGVRKDSVFNVLVDGQRRGYTRGSRATVIPLAPFSTYRVTVRPADADLYDSSAANVEREITLYPGNISLQSFTVKRIRLVYGRLLDSTGKPLKGIAVTAGNARTVTDDLGLYQLDVSVDSQTLKLKGTTDEVIVPIGKSALSPEKSKGEIDNMGTTVVALIPPVAAPENAVQKNIPIKKTPLKQMPPEPVSSLVKYQCKTLTLMQLLICRKLRSLKGVSFPACVNFSCSSALASGDKKQ